MTSKAPIRNVVAAIALLALLHGCAMGPSAPGPRESDAAAPATTRARPAADRAETAADTSPADTSPADTSPAADAEAGDALDAILAERRRGDYPEIELLETGFTITEQVRISGDARTDYARALQLLEQQRYAEGIAILERVTESAPAVTVPYIDLGIAYRQSGELESSEAALNAAARLSPENPIVHNELGIVYRQTGRFAEARASYERALEVFADFHYARRNLAVLCDLYLADLGCALANYRIYLESAGSDPEVEIWIADLQNRLANQEG